MPLSTSSKPASRPSEDVERNPSSTLSAHDGESETARIERLGRQRPEKLGSMWKEVGFVFSITVSQLLSEYFISGFTLLLPTVSEALNIPSASTTWPASAFSLVISSFLIPFGRLAGTYGVFEIEPTHLANSFQTSMAASQSTLLAALGTARGRSSLASLRMS